MTKNILPVTMLLLAMLLYTGCSSKQMYDMVMASERSSAGMKKKSLTLDFGKMAYHENSVKSEKTLVMIHGFGGNKDNWNRMVALWDGKYHVIAPDLPGHGESVSSKTLGYTTAQQAQRLETFLKAKEAKNIHIVGHSMGGAIALRYVKNNAENVKSLILIDAMGMHKTKSDGDLLVERSEKNPLYDVCTKERFETLVDYSMHKTSHIPSLFKEVMFEEKCERKALEKILYEGMFQDVKLDAIVKNITVPTLIVWGEKDRIIHPNNGKLFHETIKNSQLSVFEDIGHIPLLEDPKRTAETIDGFLEEIDP